MSLKPPVSPNAPLGTGQVYYNLVSDYGAVSGSSASLAINTLAFQKAVQAAGANGGAGTAGFLSYTISNGVSFTVTSSSGTDTRTFNWMIVRPA